MVADVLWPEVEDGRAAGNLRSALWPLQQVGCPLLVAERELLPGCSGARGGRRQVLF